MKKLTLLYTLVNERIRDLSEHNDKVAIEEIKKVVNELAYIVGSVIEQSSISTDKPKAAAITEAVEILYPQLVANLIRQEILDKDEFMSRFAEHLDILVETQKTAKQMAERISVKQKEMEAIYKEYGY